MLKLNEDLFEDKEPLDSEIPSVETEVITDSEIEPKGPEQGEATGIANIIHDLIIDENEAIQGYNNAAANMDSYPELQKIMQDIASEEFAHIGELQKALELISPNAEKIGEGEVETEENLGEESVEESLNEDFSAKMPKFSILTKTTVDAITEVEDADAEASLKDTLMEEQINKLKELGYDLTKVYSIHFFNTPFSKDSYVEETIEDAIEALAIKEGVDLVEFKDGVIGFVSYYNGKLDGFEIIENSVTEELVKPLSEASKLRKLWDMHKERIKASDEDELEEVDDDEEDEYYFDDDGNEIEDTVWKEKEDYFEELPNAQKVKIIQDFVSNYRGTTLQEDFIKQYGPASLWYLYRVEDFGGIKITSQMERDSIWNPDNDSEEILNGRSIDSYLGIREMPEVKDNKFLKWLNNVVRRSKKNAKIQEALKESIKTVEKYQGWAQEDIDLYESIDWEAQGDEDYDAGYAYLDNAVLYDKDNIERVNTEFHKFFSKDPYKKPYYKAVEKKPFDNMIEDIEPVSKGDIHKDCEVLNQYGKIN